MKNLKDLIYSVTFEYVCLFHLFTRKIIQWWEACWTLSWLFVVSTFFTHNYVLQSSIVSDYLVQILISSIAMNDFLSKVFFNFSLTLTYILLLEVGKSYKIIPTGFCVCKAPCGGKPSKNFFIVIGEGFSSCSLS